MHESPRLATPQRGIGSGATAAVRRREPAAVPAPPHVGWGIGAWVRVVTGADTTLDASRSVAGSAMPTAMTSTAAPVHRPLRAGHRRSSFQANGRAGRSTPLTKRDGHEQA